MYKAAFFALLILSIPFVDFVDARRSGGGGGGFRGSSGARTSAGGGSPNHGGGGFSPNQGGGGGFHPQQGGGFNQRPGGQQPNYGPSGGGFHGAPGGGGFQQQHGGWNRSPSFSSGHGMGSPSRASTFKYALAGAAVGAVGGLLAFEAGKAIINSATTPFHHGNRDYYFNQENYRGPANLPRCSMPLQQLIDSTKSVPPAAPVVAETTTAAPGVSTTPAPDQVLSQLQFKDGTKPREVVWSCAANEVCCGSECCPAPAGSPNSASAHGGGGTASNIGWIILLVLASFWRF